MTDRLKSLERIVTVQKQMVRLAETRLATAERVCREVTETQARLQSYVIEEGALGVSLARAALRSLHALDGKRDEAERARAASQATLQASKRREKTIQEATDRARRVQTRLDDDKALAATVETWLATRDSSLP